MCKIRIKMCKKQVEILIKMCKIICIKVVKMCKHILYTDNKEACYEKKSNGFIEKMEK